MKSVSAAIAVASTAVPAGTTAGVFHVELQNEAGVMLSSQDVADTSAAVVFASVGPGTYKVSAERLDAAGAAIGPAAVSDLFTIADVPATVNVDLPTSVTVTLA